MANNLFNAIRIAHRSPTAILNLLVDSYTADYSTFAKGNNRAPLEEAVKILTGSKLDKTIALAISKGYQEGGLTIGYIGAVTGKYSAQPVEVHEKYERAIELATAAFRVCMLDSGLFAEKPELSKAEKEKAKSEREEKKAKETTEQKANIIHAAIVAGEIVRASDVVAGASLGDAALADLISDKIFTRTLSEDNARSMIIDLTNGFTKIAAMQVDCLINLKMVDRVTMALMLESLNKAMDKESWDNMLSHMGYAPAAPAPAAPAPAAPAPAAPAPAAPAPTKKAKGKKDTATA